MRPCGHYNMWEIRASIFAVVLFGGVVVAHGQKGDGFPMLSQPERIEYAASGALSSYFSGRERPHLAPSSEILDAVRSDLDSIEANLGVEVLFRDSPDVVATDMLSAVNRLLSVSDMEGLEYYSASRDRMRLLFERSYVVLDQAARDPAPDLRIDALPSTGEFLVFQRDLTFGDNVLAVSYRATEVSVHVAFTNLTPFRYGPLRIIKRGSLRMHVYLVPTESGVHYYGVFGARSMNISFLEKRVHNSFYNRLDALHRWFIRNGSNP